jgi:putative transcriptional regulator
MSRPPRKADLTFPTGLATLTSSRLYMEPIVQNRVRELRAARDWTQERLAEAVGVSRQSIISIERGRYIPSLPLALLLARVFACPIEQIFTLENQP